MTGWLLLLNSKLRLLSIYHKIGSTCIVIDVRGKNDFAGYPALNVSIKSGQEHFQLKGQPLYAMLLDFWRWSASDLVNNALRGQLAEYIVAQALGITFKLRSEWDAYDLLTSKGTRIEVIGT